MGAPLPKFLFDSRLQDAAPVASTTAAGFDVLNVADMRVFTWWRPTAMPATITVDCGAAKTVDYWALWGHDLFTTGNAVQLRGSTDNFSASDVLVDSVTPADDKPFARYITQANYRYWRLRFVNGSVPTIAIALLGDVLDIPAGVRTGFDPIGRDVVEQYNRSVKGNPLGKVIEYEDWSQTLTFELVTWAWIRATWLPAWKAHINAEPFLLSWDAANYPAELHYAVAGDKFSTPHNAGGYTDLVLPVSGLAIDL